MSLRHLARRLLERFADQQPATEISGSTTRHIKVGQRKRWYDLHISPTLDQSKPSPLIIGLHGRNSAPGQFAYLSQLNRRGGGRGYVIAYPAAEGGVWNPAFGKENYDVIFVQAMIDEIQTILPVDTDRIYAVGMSNGGQMAYRLACELSDRLAAIGVCVCGMNREECSPKNPVSVIHFQGTQDPLVPLAWGEYAISRWIRYNQCELEPVETYKNGAARCVTHTNPATKAEVTFCTIDGMGHQYPGLAIKLTENEANLLGLPPILAHLGPGTDDLDATGMLLEFFARHVRRTSFQGDLAGDE